ncbi:Endoplasmic reticulum membrane protein 65 [Cladobotryum mycophilum]|uniref:Endoplasmic reticulum membrane protein 65 n=1 Tax=Cladobotryum mycophilum TaxID=491253 RepID=A0ABR0SWL5_9HYPO
MAVTADPINPIPAPSFSSSAPTSRRPSNLPGVLPEPLHNFGEDEALGGSSPVRGRAKNSWIMPGATDLSNGAAGLLRDGGGGGAGDMMRQRSGSGTMKKTLSHDNVPRLSAAEVKELTSSARSLPVAPAPLMRRSIDQEYQTDFKAEREAIRRSLLGQPEIQHPDALQPNGIAVEARGPGVWRDTRDPTRRPVPALRTVSTPPTTRFQSVDVPSGSTSPRRFSANPASRPPSLHLNLEGINGNPSASIPSPGIKTEPPTFTSQQPPNPPPTIRPPSPIPPMIPLPPMSIPTHLQLELAAQRPSPLYIHPSHTTDTPYESHAVKFERLKNVLLIPPFLERTLNFGALACLDAWLHTFTILPIRFMIALMVLIRWWVYVMIKEVKWLIGFVWYGLGRVWRRGRTARGRTISDVSDSGRSRSCSRASERSVDAAQPNIRQRQSRVRMDSRVRNSDDPKSSAPIRDPGPKSGSFRHRRTKSMPSNLSSFHKADLLQGAVIICSSLVLMKLDASRMYHLIRAQSAIKLYVVYNILEVGDRLLSALGQDILECLFSAETLSRNASGRSKILLPMGMFILALTYSCLHSVALYYQVITLNVAVNSYSNALLTLLLSNQFVEIKSTVFKRFEKDNLFQLTCADIVERFHLWIMLLIIGMRNIVEVGGLSIPSLTHDLNDSSAAPMHPPSILPHSFTVLPSWLMSGEVLSPFLIVVGSEMLVDSIKHAYVTKFNNIRPRFYSRILDILCKDYYTNAFTTPALTRRLGLAVIPLSCLFIRASIQTYHMLLSAHVPMPFPVSTQTSLTEESAVPSSPAMTAALNRLDALIRDSLGRATYGYPYGSPLNSRPWYSLTSDDVIAALTMVVVFFIIFLVLLILKLLLGMVLLQYARNRYAKMKNKEALVAAGKAEWENYNGQGKRIGGYGHVEVGEDRSRWVNADATEGLKRNKGGKRASAEDKKGAQDGDYQGVFRYEMVEKRIW